MKNKNKDEEITKYYQTVLEKKNRNKTHNNWSRTAKSIEGLQQ